MEQDPALSMQFELNGLPIINEEMEKAADQKGIIFKDTRSNADKRAEEAFAKGVDRVRKETNDSYKGLIVVLNFADPVAEIDRATL